MRILLSAEDISQRVNALADRFSAQVNDDWTVVALLQGAIPFAADLMRALEVRGSHPIYDSLWLESYRDERESSGKVVVRADVLRLARGDARRVLKEGRCLLKGGDVRLVASLRSAVAGRETLHVDAHHHHSGPWGAACRTSLCVAGRCLARQLCATGIPDRTRW